MTILSPVPIGLFVAGLAAASFSRSAFFPWFAWTVIHYGIIWMTDPVNTLSALEQYDFMFEYLLVYAQGVLAGVAFAWAFGTPHLIPEHTFDRKRPAYGVFLLTIAIIFAIRAIMIATGQYTKFTNFPAGNQTVHGVAAAVWIALGIFVFVVSYIGTKLPILRWFVISQQRDAGLPREYDRILPDFVLALAALLSTQAIWDFLSPPRTDYILWSVGAVTVTLQTIVWGAIYIWFSKVRRIQENLFSSDNSVISWEVFCIFNAVAYLLVGVTWIITLELTDNERTGRLVINLILAALSAAAIVLFLFLRKRRNELDPIGKTNSNMTLGQVLWKKNRYQI